MKLTDAPPTPSATLTRARDIACRAGLRYVYTGNVHDRTGDATWCPGCGTAVIERDWYDLGEWCVRSSSCGHCGHPLPGLFEDQPGQWGNQRQAVRFR